MKAFLFLINTIQNFLIYDNINQLLENKHIVINNSGRKKMLGRGIKKILKNNKNFIKNIKNKNFQYVDIGACDGMKTEAVTKVLGISNKNTFCLDLDKTVFLTETTTNICKYKTYSGKQFPFKPGVVVGTRFLVRHS